jgi:hypothetical protein
MQPLDIKSLICFFNSFNIFYLNMEGALIGGDVKPNTTSILWSASW